jgi:hypothetical protein
MASCTQNEWKGPKNHANRGARMDLTLSESVMQKANTALGVIRQPHRLFYNGNIMETGAMEWSDMSSIPTIMVNTSPELLDARGAQNTR